MSMTHSARIGYIRPMLQDLVDNHMSSVVDMVAAPLVGECVQQGDLDSAVFILDKLLEFVKNKSLDKYFREKCATALAYSFSWFQMISRLDEDDHSEYKEINERERYLYSHYSDHFSMVYTRMATEYHMQFISNLGDYVSRGEALALRDDFEWMFVPQNIFIINGAEDCMVILSDDTVGGHKYHYAATNSIARFSFNAQKGEAAY